MLDHGAMASSSLQATAAVTRREQILLGGSPGYAGGVSELPDKLAAIRAAAGVFAECGVAYALIGGVAVSVRSGVPRATLDVDFAIPSTAARAVLAERMAERGFSPGGQFAHSMNFKHASGEPVQLAFDPAFDSMIERAEILELGDLSLRVVTKQDLIEMKRRSASDPTRRRSKALRDLADIALLEGDVPTPDEGW
jgi:Nucleotidyl transferase AbiEii toxin, Type IV TA system